MLAAWAGLRPTQPELLRGLVLISGMYDITRHSAEIINTASPRYVPRLYEAIEHLPPHTVIVAGDADLPAVMPDAQALHQPIAARGGSVELYVEPNADHFQANRSFVTPGGHVAERVKALL